MSPQEFDGRVAIVTGASSGIGRATAEMLLSRGAIVAAFARTATSAGLDPRMLAIDGDVSDPDAIERLFAETESRLGDCDILINSAGMIDPKILAEVTPEDWDRMFAVNVRGTFAKVCPPPTFRPPSSTRCARGLSTVARSCPTMTIPGRSA